MALGRYGVMISAIFQVVDYAAIGTAFMGFALEGVVRKIRERQV